MLCDDVHRLLYSTAACHFHVTPRGAVVPRGTEDLRRIVRFAAERGIPLTARGAGTGLAGQTLGEGIILDCSRRMNRILEVDPANRVARVQPGVVLDQLNRALKPHGLWFAPDPSSGSVCTVGGMIANNSGGARSLKYGTTKDHLRSLRLVLDSGDVWDARRYDIGGEEFERLVTGEGRIPHLIRETYDLLGKNLDRIQSRRPAVAKNSSGYNLWEALDQAAFDPCRLIAGSEGTLALVAEAELNLTPLPGGRALLRADFDDVRRAGEAVVRLKELQPSALEILDRTLLDLVRDSLAEQGIPLGDGLASLLLIEFEGETPAEAAAALDRAETMLRKNARGLLGTIRATEPEAQAKVWKVRKAASPILERMRAERRSTRLIEDAAVPPARLPEYIEGLQALFARHAVKGFIFGHAGSGNIHVNLLLDYRAPEDRRRMEAIADEACVLIGNLRGTLSGEHGDGILRTPYLERMFGKEICALFAKVKGIFDPKGILNPGKKVPAGPVRFTEHLRPLRSTLTHGEGLLSPWWQKEAERCNGCGTCRTYCPVYQGDPSEETTARSKANLVMGILAGEVDAEALAKSGTLRRVMDTCANCKRCLDACPAGVDIPGVAIEAKAYARRLEGESLRDAVLARPRTVGRAGALLAPLANWANRQAWFRSSLEKASGIDRRRILPAFRWPFRLGGWGAPNPTSTRKVVYFSGCTADFNDPDGEKASAIEVLRRNGCRVDVPSLRCCGVAALSQGNRDAVVADAAWNVERLAGFVKEGYAIVTTAPSCGITLRHDYRRLVDTPEAVRVADATMDLYDYLLRLHKEGALDTSWKLPPTKIGYQVSCHVKAQGGEKAVKKILAMIPGVELVDLGENCCGGLGTFGMKVEHFDESMRIGEPLFERIRKAAPDVILSSSGTCQLQVEQGAGRKARHPAWLLARAYAETLQE